MHICYCVHLCQHLIQYATNVWARITTNAHSVYFTKSILLIIQCNHYKHFLMLATCHMVHCTTTKATQVIVVYIQYFIVLFMSSYSLLVGVVINNDIEQPRYITPYGQIYIVYLIYGSTVNLLFFIVKIFSFYLKKRKYFI